VFCVSMQACRNGSCKNTEGRKGGDTPCCKREGKITQNTGCFVSEALLWACREEVAEAEQSISELRLLFRGEVIW